MPFEKLEDRRMYTRAEQVADRVWAYVSKWSRFAQNTVGEQLTTAADSIGANIAEAGGRFFPNDVKKFLYYARGSLRETIYWLRRTKTRALIGAADVDKLLTELEQLSREINGAIAFQKKRSDS
jgi:four helix bundle protein